MIEVYTAKRIGENWLNRYRGKKPLFACILGFTATGVIPHISAAGATPQQRQYTAIADAEFLINGGAKVPKYPLPPLTAGASPVLISRAVVESCNLPVYLFNAGLPTPPAVPAIDLGGKPAQCVSSGQALSKEIVKHLWQQGLEWGEKLGKLAQNSYVIIGECVVGGTTTALALLTGLGIEAKGRVNSSHRLCNHQQKWEIVQQGLTQAGFKSPYQKIDPFELVAAVGDPMQIVAAAMAIAVSKYAGVMLAGGTQMLAVYALVNAVMGKYGLNAKLEQIVIGTTRWVIEDSTGDTIGLTTLISQQYQLDTIPLMGTKLNLSNSVYPSLRAYEQGYVKEGVGAGACAIAASLYQGYSQEDLLGAIEKITKVC